MRRFIFVGSVALILSGCGASKPSSVPPPNSDTSPGSIRASWACRDWAKFTDAFASLQTFEQARPLGTLMDKNAQQADKAGPGTTWSTLADAVSNYFEN